MRMALRNGALILIFSGMFGCNSEPTAPKTDLDAKDKAHLKELDEQRASEWGAKSKKK